MLWFFVAAAIAAWVFFAPSVEEDICPPPARHPGAFPYGEVLHTVSERSPVGYYGAPGDRHLVFGPGYVQDVNIDVRTGLPLGWNNVFAVPAGTEGELHKLAQKNKAEFKKELGRVGVLIAS